MQIFTKRKKVLERKLYRFTCTNLWVYVQNYTLFTRTRANSVQCDSLVFEKNL